MHILAVSKNVTAGNMSQYWLLLFLTAILFFYYLYNSVIIPNKSCTIPLILSNARLSAKNFIITNKYNLFLFCYYLATSQMIASPIELLSGSRHRCFVLTIVVTSRFPWFLATLPYLILYIYSINTAYDIARV